jgi:hypothetical protein
MKKKIAILALLLSAAAFSQEHFQQYSIEADYGFNYVRNPKLSGLNHFGVGFRYMIDEYWGVKFDYGHESFSTNTSAGTGSDYHRFSAQAVYNLGRALNFRQLTNGNVNMLLHAGLGASGLDSDTLEGMDKMGNVIAGGTLQLYVSDSFAITGDASGILNFSQQRRFDGISNGGEFTGKMFTVSLGLTYYFGRNKSTADWR